MFIGIISYLPDNQADREKRLEFIKKQLSWVKAKFPNYQIVTVAQNYRDQDCQPEVDRYIRFSDGIGPAAARNKLLSELYNSDHEAALFLDDDTVLYDYYGATDLVDLIAERPDCTELDMIAGISPTMMGYKYDIIQNKERVADNFTFMYTPRTCQVFLLRNLKKYYNKEIYFEERSFNDNKWSLAEDLIFPKELIYNGLKIKTCSEWIYKNIGVADSTIVSKEDSKQRHLDVTRDTMLYICDKYNLNGREEILRAYNTNMTPAERLNMVNVTNKSNREFQKRYNALYGIRSYKLDIPRKQRYEFQPGELDYKPRPRKS